MTATEQTERNERWLQARLRGDTYGRIATGDGVSAERVKQVVKRLARRRGIRLPARDERGLGGVPFECVEALVAAEKQLRRAGASSTRAARLMVAHAPGDGPGSGLDREKWLFIVRCLLEQGWRIAADRERAELWFFAPANDNDDNEGGAG